MPGFQLERFVDLSETERTELQCIICRDILKDPLFAKCCLQTFCEECINQWLINNSTCPYDRQNLNSEQLTRPPRILLNMLAKLTISCTFKANGCKEVVSLDNLNNHLNSCFFNKKLCEKCNFELVVGHDCIENLLELSKTLELQLNNTRIRIDCLETENENHLQTIQQFCQKLGQNYTLKISENQMLIDARKHLNSLSLITKTTPKKMTDKIVSIVKETINKGIKLYDICVEIRKCVETEFGGLWVCHTFYDNTGRISCTVDNNFFVSLIIGKLRISVHKVYDEIDFTKISGRLCCNDFDKDFSIFKTDMNSESIKIIKLILLNGFQKFDNWTDFIENIFNELPKAFGGVWNCIVYKKSLGHFCVIPKTRHYINFYILDLDFAIFQILN